MGFAEKPVSVSVSVSVPEIAATVGPVAESGYGDEDEHGDQSGLAACISTDTGLLPS